MSAVTDANDNVTNNMDEVTGVPEKFNTKLHIHQDGHVDVGKQNVSLNLEDL